MLNPQDESSQISRFAAARPRLLASFVLGAASVVVAPAGHGWLSRLLLGWDIAVWTYLVLITMMMLRADPGRIRAVARREDTSASAVLAVVCLGVVASMVAIAFELATAKSAGHAQTSHYVFTGITVLGAWLMVPMMFTVHYAHLYYYSPEHRLPLQFPEGLKSPSYIDFMYFALTISVAVQTSDVSVRTTAMRANVMVQSVLCFFFNLAILGLSINIAAGLTQGH